tara:strand:+ start:368 stop:634 length:267 start_codon:yes stop_codon:yes gene_type:complete
MTVSALLVIDNTSYSEFTRNTSFEKNCGATKATGINFTNGIFDLGIWWTCILCAQSLSKCQDFVNDGIFREAHFNSLSVIWVIFVSKL